MDDTTTSGARPKRSRFGAGWKRLRRYPTALIGLIIVAFFLLMAIIGPAVAPYTYSAQNLSDALSPPSPAHLMGTDNYGRDIFSRIIVGSRDVYATAGSATALAVVFGLAIGLFSGYAGGLFDEIVMRLMDVIMAIPSLLLAMVVLFSLGPSRVNLIIVVGFLYIPIVARVVRSVVLDVKNRQFVEAAKLRGESTSYILFKEIMPNVLPHLAVEASMRFSYAIFTIASLGFLGLGIQPPAPDWGFMVSEARTWYDQAPWILLAPSATIAVLVVSVSFMSDGLNKILLPGGVSND